MDTPITEQQSLDIIHKMIENSKTKFRDNSFHFILWGWLVSITSVVHFVLFQLEYLYFYMGWPIMMLGGGMISAIVGYKSAKKIKAKTIYDSAMLYLWGAFFISVILINIMVRVLGVHEAYIPVFILLLSAIATMVTGGILNFKPLIFGGGTCWVWLAICLFVPLEYIVLVSGISTITAYLIPGYLLKKKVKKNV